MTKETRKAIAIDPLLLKETAEAKQKLAHLIERLIPYLSPEEIVQKTMEKFQEQKEEFIKDFCEEIESKGTFEYIDRLQDLQKAKSTFIAHCFRIMLHQGIGWTEILQEISNRLPRDENNKEKIDQLQSLGDSLTLTLKDFS